MKKIKNKLENLIIVGIIVVAVLLVFSQSQLAAINSTLTPSAKITSKTTSGSTDLSGVDVYEISSTAMAVALLFPELDNIQNEQDAIRIMIPTGTPGYSEALGGISFDDPVTSMEYLAKWYNTIKSEVKQNEPEIWQRYLKLAAAPRGISCEFCCGVGPQGINADGNLRCGCKHNPAVQALTLGLMKGTDYTDAEILREVMKWKTIFFPKNMVGLAMQVAGTDPSQLKNLPGMVGGC